MARLTNGLTAPLTDDRNLLPLTVARRRYALARPTPRRLSLRCLSLRRFTLRSLSSLRRLALRRFTLRCLALTRLTLGRLALARIHAITCLCLPLTLQGRYCLT